MWMRYSGEKKCEKKFVYKSRIFKYNILRNI